jgi:hypothetical protein
MASQALTILKAKQAEFKAIPELSKQAAKSLLPLFEYCVITDSIRKAARFKGVPDLTRAYLDEVSDGIASVWKGRAALVDAFPWKPDATTGYGEHIIPYIYNGLTARGVNVIPTIGYDRWDSNEYRLALQGLGFSSEVFFCLRLDTHAIEDSAEPDFFVERVQEIIDELDLDPSRCLALVDFADVSRKAVTDLVEEAKRVVDLLAPLGITSFATAGCSLSSSINEVVPQVDSSAKILRKESIVWRTLRTEYTNLTMLHGDYGVRGPTSAEEVKSPHTNGKIRYTIDKAFFVARGHSLCQGNKGEQMYSLSNTVMKSGYFMGPQFSWAEQQIERCKNEEFKGIPATWITIDTVQHITWITAEIREFETQLANAAASS